MYLFLSPHFGDAVYSCGGTIHQLAARNEPVVVRTIMGGKPTQLPDTPNVRDMHQRWGHGDNAVAARIAEDETAVKRLGATPQRLTVWMDCIYRTSRSGQPLYPTDASLFDKIHPDDMAGTLLPTVILSPQEKIQGLYAPLGVGNHVDHQIIRNWVLELHKQYPALALRFYEEYPYMEYKNGIDKALSFFNAQGVHLKLEVVSLTEADVTARIQAMADYTSQISSWWKSTDALAQSVRQFVNRIGDGQPAERFWRTVDL